MEKIQELFVVLDNKPGALGELCELLAKHNVNIETIGVFVDSAKLLVRNIDKTKKILETNNYTVEIRDVLRFEIPNKPGELAYITTRISHVGLNIDHLYASAKPGDKTVTLIIDVDDVETAMTLFR